MKRLILISALALPGFMANAQTAFGVHAGANFATVKSEVGNETNTSDTRTGFTIGVVGDADFGSSVSFRPELNFIQKGGKEESTSVNGGFTTRSTNDLMLNYIQLSPNFVYNIPAGSGKFFLGLGPEFSLGIGGKNKFTTTTTGGSTTITTEGKTDVKFDGDETPADNKFHLKSFDFGGNLLAGYTMRNGFLVSAGYTLGFANILPDNNSDNTFKNRGFNVKVGFMFSGNGTKKRK